MRSNRAELWAQRVREFTTSPHPNLFVNEGLAGDESGRFLRPCGDDRIRTDDPLVANQVLCQAELRPQRSQHCRTTLTP